MNTQWSREQTSGEQVPSTAHRFRRILGLVAMTLALLLIVSCTAYVAYVHHSLSGNIRHETMLPNPDDTTGSSGEGHQADGSPGREGTPKTAMDVLLIGSDRIQTGDVERSDVIMLAHLSGDCKKIYLVHFPRDMYVNIHGVGMARINAAYANGGAPLLVETLEDMLNIHIDHVAAITSDGFIAMTDAVGGVDVYAEEASTEYEVNIHVGWNHLDGAEASVFVRERHQLTRGDISRGRRQQSFIRALMLKALSKETLMNPVRFAKFVDAVTRNLTVDTGLSVDEIYSEALKLRNIRSGDFVFITAPITKYAFTAEGASVALVDEGRLTSLGDALRNDTMADYPAGEQIP